MTIIKVKFLLGANNYKYKCIPNKYQAKFKILFPLLDAIYVCLPTPRLL